MLRRAFLKLVSSAGLAMVVSTHHFKQLPEESVTLLDANKEEITELLSPVLMATRAWNDRRWEQGGVVWETGAGDQVPLVKSRFIAGRTFAGDRFDKV